MFFAILMRMKSVSIGPRATAGLRPNNAAGHGVKRQSPLWLPALLTLIFAGFTLLPRVNANPHLLASFLAAPALLFAALCSLWMSMRACFFTDGGLYWREVSHGLPLMIAQVAFIYVLDMLVCWSRRDKWIL